jgi:hypothetical protein
VCCTTGQPSLCRSGRAHSVTNSWYMRADERAKRTRPLCRQQCPSPIPSSRSSSFARAQERKALRAPLNSAKAGRLPKEPYRHCARQKPGPHCTAAPQSSSSSPGGSIVPSQQVKRERLLPLTDRAALSTASQDCAEETVEVWGVVAEEFSGSVIQSMATMDGAAGLPPSLVVGPRGSERLRPGSGPARIIVTRLVLMDYYRPARLISCVLSSVRGSRTTFAFAYSSSEYYRELTPTARRIKMLNN